VYEIDTGIEHRFTWDDGSIATFSALDGDGIRLAGDSYGGRDSDDDPAIVRIWSFESKDLLDEIEVAVGWETGYLHFNPVRPELLITRSQWTEENETIHELDLWDVDRLHRLATTPLPDAPFRITVSPDGVIVAIATLDKRVYLYDAASLKEIFTVVPPDYADAICFDRDTTVLVTGGGGGGGTEDEEAATTIWDLESRTQIASRSAGPGLVGTALAMHPEGREIAMGTGLAGDSMEETEVSGQREIFVWDLQRDASSDGFEVEAWYVVALRYTGEGDVLEVLVQLDNDLFAWERWERVK
jgi:WD40 repeat protein